MVKNTKQEKNRLSLKIVRHYLFLGVSIKGRIEFMKEITEEVTRLGRKNCNLTNLWTPEKLDQVLKP